MVKIQSEQEIVNSKCPHGVLSIRHCDFCYAVMYNTKGIAYLDKDLKRKARKNISLFK
jgi:hypothetical protein